MSIWLAIGTIAGIILGFSGWEPGFAAAEVTGTLFLNLLKMVSVPLIFLSVLSTLTGMSDLREVRSLGGRVVKYTLLTTIAAATVALILFLIISPAHGGIEIPVDDTAAGHISSYGSHLLSVIPTSFVQPFVEGNVISAIFLAFLMSAAVLTIDGEKRVSLHSLFDALLSMIMQVTHFILKLLPFAVAAFIALFIRQICDDKVCLSNLMRYFAVVISANLVQAFIVLPLLLKWKGIPPMKIAKAMLPALSFAFFAKSSSASLPYALKCAEDLGVSKKVSRFTFPLCITINMNGCAGFILTTVLFVSMVHGVTYTPIELVGWIFLATLAAVGNAGVPMGCYLLSSAFLAAMGIPLNIMGAILPVYALIDMLETAINVWSDSCVAVIVDKEVAASEETATAIAS